MRLSHTIVPVIAVVTNLDVSTQHNNDNKRFDACRSSRSQPSQSASELQAKVSHAVNSALEVISREGGIESAMQLSENQGADGPGHRAQRSRGVRFSPPCCTVPVPTLCMPCAEPVPLRKCCVVYTTPHVRTRTLHVGGSVQPEWLLAQAGTGPL